MRSKQRILISGRAQGGGSFGRGALYHLLQNRIYRGEAVHKGVAYPGEHKAIVDEELWRAVQDRLAANRTIRRKSRIETGALLGGLIYDDRGNIMSPTYSIRRGNRYRYYISSALLHDRRPDAGSLARINADDVERLVILASAAAANGLPLEFFARVIWEESCLFDRSRWRLHRLGAGSLPQ